MSRSLVTVDSLIITLKIFCGLLFLTHLSFLSFYFRGQMISQEDYNFITRLDNSSPEQRIQLLKEKSYQVIKLV